MVHRTVLRALLATQVNFSAVDYGRTTWSTSVLSGSCARAMLCAQYTLNNLDWRWLCDHVTPGTHDCRAVVIACRLLVLLLVCMYYSDLNGRCVRPLSKQQCLSFPLPHMGPAVQNVDKTGCCSQSNALCWVHDDRL